MSKALDNKTKLNSIVNVLEPRFGYVAGAADNTAACTAALASLAATGGQLYIPAGTHRMNITLTQGNVDICGDGKSTIIEPTSGDALTVSGITAGLGGTVRNLTISGTAGATRGLVCSGFSRGRFSDIYIKDIGTAIYVNGDNSTETFFSDIYCVDITAYGVRYERTTTTDTGGVYFARVSVTGNNAAVGFRFNSANASRTRAFAFMSDCVIDNRAAYAIYAKNVTNIFYSNGWLTGTYAGGALVHLEDTKDIWMQGAYVQNSSASGYNFYLADATEDFQAHNLRLSGPGTAWQFDAGFVATRCRVWSTDNSTTTITNDRAKYDSLTRIVPLSFLAMGTEDTQTIASGAVTAQSSRTLLLGEGGVADNLDTINGGNTGDVLVLSNGSSAYAITVKHATGNIRLSSGSDRTLSGPNPTITLIKRNTGAWLEMSYSANV